jgi:hypothetical protein
MAHAWAEEDTIVERERIQRNNKGTVNGVLTCAILTGLFVYFHLWFVAVTLGLMTVAIPIHHLAEILSDIQIGLLTDRLKRM